MQNEAIAARRTVAMGSLVLAEKAMVRLAEMLIPISHTFEAHPKVGFIG